ncbi:hypothetical protein C0Q70_08416 [Pomacea canaliculata]|uniref:EF-hand domain-containing protein n=1 Tax=Pomacea canaliculata TaxID=400727 RepID=A0A2T7PHR9_POMCA|nr:hypothetical protein C0Q70_08416 [Pomacea canaliculata]
MKHTPRCRPTLCRKSGTQGRPGSPSSADDGHIRDDLDLLTDVTGGSTSTRRSGGTEVVNNKTIPTVNFPSTPSQQSEPPPGTFRRNLEESRKKSSKDDSTCKSSTSAKSKSSKSSSSRGSGKPLPADGQDEGGRDKRLNGAKKGKKCQDRHHSRKGAEGEGGNAPQTEETAETTKAAPEAGENLLEVNVKVPDLPHARSPKRDQGRSPGNKNERRLIPPPSEGRQMLPHELLDLNLYHLTGFDFGDMEASTADSSRKKQTSWMNDRMALSQQSSRFELPMDMKELERITPQEYLKTFCIVTSRRLNLYQKVFIKHKDRTNHLNKESLTQCLKEVLIEMLTEDTLSEVFQLVEISEETRIDFRLFSGIAALAERMLYPNYTQPTQTNQPTNQPNQTKPTNQPTNQPNHHRHHHHQQQQQEEPANQPTNQPKPTKPPPPPPPPPPHQQQQQQTAAQDVKHFLLSKKRSKGMLCHRGHDGQERVPTRDPRDRGLRQPDLEAGRGQGRRGHEEASGGSERLQREDGETEYVMRNESGMVFV